jgi:hypothetical protein
MYSEESVNILGRKGRKALIFSLLQAIIMIPLFLAALVLVSVRVGPKLYLGNEFKRAGFIPLYAFISILAQIFQFGLSIEAARYKNTIQVVFIAVFNIIHLLFCALQTYEWQIYKKALQEIGTPYKKLDILPIMGTITGCMLCFTIISSWNAYEIYKEFGWSLFERNGASLQKKKILTLFHTYTVLLKLCWFFNFSIPLQIMWGLILDKIDKTTAALLPFSSALWWTWIVTISIISFVLAYFGEKVMAQGSKGFCILMFSLLTLNSTLVCIGASLVDRSIFDSIFYYIMFFVVVSVTLNTIDTIFGILCFLEIKNGLSVLGNFTNFKCSSSTS